MFYFTLGVLTVVALTLVGVVILGMIKVSKLQKRIVEIEDQIGRNFDNAHRRIDDENRFFHNRIDQIYSEIEKQHHDCISYTDKRIDKVIYHYKEKES